MVSSETKTSVPDANDNANNRQRRSNSILGELDARQTSVQTAGAKGRGEERRGGKKAISKLTEFSCSARSTAGASVLAISDKRSRAILRCPRERLAFYIQKGSAGIYRNTGVSACHRCSKDCV